MSILPSVSDLKAIEYEYFPTKWQAVVWRNWGYVPTERIARALGTTYDNIRNAAEELGLNPNEPANNMWLERGYLTIIRNNWHLCTYEQIMILLNISEEELAFTLKEDDFLWVKLGEIKPSTEAATYTPLTEQEKEQTKKIAAVFRERFPMSSAVSDNGFAFLEEFYQPLTEKENHEDSCLLLSNSDSLRMIYPYFTLSGDVLLDENHDPFPERLLRHYAEAGINGIWMQGLLYQLVEFPFDPSISKGWEKRIQALKKLVEKAKKYNIGLYLYLNEPRSMPDAFFQKYPHLRGEQEGDFYALCTSTPEVQDYLYKGMKKLFTMVPDLAGYFTITMSENLTNCYSRIFVVERMGPRETVCPRCSRRAPWEVVAEVNNLMAKGTHEAAPQAKAISWTWGWPDEWAEKVVPLLAEGQIIQCTSEEAMPFCIGGVNGSVLDYTMSLCGPGEKAKNMWHIAKECNMQTGAKVQINNSWEMAAVPYIPVFDKVAEHIEHLKEQGISHLHVSWTLGGCPSPNLRLTAWLMGERGTLQEFLYDWLGEEIGSGVYIAQKQLSQAFSHFPFHMESLYYGPQNYGPMAPFFLKKTGYRASMVGYPYDDVERWSAIYPTDIYEDEYRNLCEGWKEGLKLLLPYKGVNKELDEIILMAQVALGQYESTYHHIRFVKQRNEFLETKDEVIRRDMLNIVQKEMNTVQEIISLRLSDSRVGYESSNHYFYTLQDLKEKLLNLVWCEEELCCRRMVSVPENT